MRIIGLTGGIGSGKSTVARFLAELGAGVVDLDKIGHEALKPGGAARERVVDEFGKDILTAGGDIDRAKLGKLVFRDRRALRRLNRITHPAIDTAVNTRLEEYRRQGVRVVVLEAAAMLEAGKASQADEIWVTVAPEATVLERLGERGGLSREESQARIRAQLTNEERVKHADAIIDTDCSLDELKARVALRWQQLQARMDSGAG
jgi:dephospho-CoA kinase